MVRTWLLLLVCVGADAGCASTAAPGQNGTAPAAVPPEMERIELSSVIPAPGIVFAVQLRPAQLYENAMLRRTWSKVFSANRLAVYQQASGLSLNEIDDLWIVGYPLGTLVLLDASTTGDRVEQAFLDRAAAIRTETYELERARFHVGLMDGEPQALYHRSGDLIAIATGDIALAKIVFGYATGRLKAPTAMDTRFVAPLSDFESFAPVRAFLMGPFETATDAVAQGFAAGVLALNSVQTDLEVRMVARGAWPSQKSRTLSLWLQQVLDTRELRALGLGFPREVPVVECTEERPGGEGTDMALTRCSTSVAYDAAGLADSVYRLTQAPSEELLDPNTPMGWRSRLLAPPSDSVPP